MAMGKCVAVGSLNLVCRAGTIVKRQGSVPQRQATSLPYNF